MRYIIRLLIIFVMVLQANILKGQNFTKITDLTKINEEMSKVAINIKTIVADFIQEKHLDVLDIVVESKGVFIYKSPQKLRWEYKSPYKYLVLLNDGKFSIIQKNNIKEFDLKSSESFQGISDLIINSIKGNIISNPKFKVSVFEDKISYKIKLVPINEKMNQIISTIEIIMNKNTKMVDQLTMYENEKDYTLIKFYNKKMNEKVSDENFINN